MADIVRREENRPARRLEWDPFEAMREMLRWDPFSEMLPSPLVGERATFAPRFEVKESGDSYVFKADLPGVKESDLDISLTGNRLSISGKREAEERHESERYFAYERSFGSFSRTFTLPEGVDTEHAQADLREGVLTVIVPKRPETQARRIQVKGSAEKEQAKA